MCRSLAGPPWYLVAATQTSTESNLKALLTCSILALYGGDYVSYRLVNL